MAMASDSAWCPKRIAFAWNTFSIRYSRFTRQPRTASASDHCGLRGHAAASALLSMLADDPGAGETIMTGLLTKNS